MAGNNKSKSARTSRELDLAGFLLRLVATTALVLATYNPSGWSYAHWLKTAFTAAITAGEERREASSLTSTADMLCAR